MGSSSTSAAPASPEFIAVFRSRADKNGRMTFAAFMELALYHPKVGYYRGSQPRIGRTRDTDFYTASTMGSMFGELVRASCASLLRTAGRDPHHHTFVEIGVELGSEGVLAGQTHPFQAAKTVTISDTLTLTGDCVIFSNELFDAQPCVRSVFRTGRWVETGVELRGETLVEVELETVPQSTPDATTEGYRFDQPLAAAALAERIATQAWRGLFVAFDYGKTFRTLTEETPGGTTRAYYRHTQSNNLLAHPGEQDLTCHVCWDWISDALRRHGFSDPNLSFQEAFFIRNAGEFIATFSAAEANRMSQRKLALLQLLHPSDMGQKFQVMHAFR